MQDTPLSFRSCCTCTCRWTQRCCGLVVKVSLFCHHINLDMDVRRTSRKDQSRFVHPFVSRCMPCFVVSCSRIVFPASWYRMHSSSTHRQDIPRNECVAIHFVAMPLRHTCVPHIQGYQAPAVDTSSFPLVTSWPRCHFPRRTGGVCLDVNDQETLIFKFCSFVQLSRVSTLIAELLEAQSADR